jgi:hypothetical protein
MHAQHVPPATRRIAVGILIAEQPQSIPDHPVAGPYHCVDALCHLARPRPRARRRGNAGRTRNSKEVKADKKNQIAVLLRSPRGRHDFELVAHVIGLRNAVRNATLTAASANLTITYRWKMSRCCRVPRKR